MSRYSHKIMSASNEPVISIDPGPYYSLPKTLKYNLPVSEMHTAHDFKLVMEALVKVPGLLECYPNLEEHTVTVKFDKSLCNLEMLTNAILGCGLFNNCYNKYR